MHLEGILSTDQPINRPSNQQPPISPTHTTHTYFSNASASNAAIIRSNSSSSAVSVGSPPAPVPAPAFDWPPLRTAAAAPAALAAVAAIDVCVGLGLLAPLQNAMMGRLNHTIPTIRSLPRTRDLACRSNPVMDVMSEVSMRLWRVIMDGDVDQIDLEAPQNQLPSSVISGPARVSGHSPQRAAWRARCCVCVLQSARRRHDLSPISQSVVRSINSSAVPLRTSIDRQAEFG